MKYQRLELVSHHLCPYVQRSVITLKQKNIKHERIYVDLSNTPVWFEEMSPTGKVPLLIVDNQSVLFESAVICEFLNEVTSESLHSEDPLIKAEHRAWIEFASNILDSIGRLYSTDNADIYMGITKNLGRNFMLLEKQVKLPYFNGDHFSMVDAAYGPIFRYFDTMDPYMAFDIFSNTPKVCEWRENLAGTPSIKQAVTKDYPELLEDFLIKRNSYISQLIKSRP